MRSNSVTVEPHWFMEQIGRLLFVLGLRRSRLSLRPITEDILVQLRNSTSVITPYRGSGKTTALLVYARELMGRYYTDNVAIISPWSGNPQKLAELWRRYFPFERSPLFTTSVADLHGIDYVLIDEPRYLATSVKSELTRLVDSPSGPHFAGEVGS